MVKIHTLEIAPPLLNSSCAWASDYAQLRELYDSPYTGAVTTRTATLDGFKEDGQQAVVFTAENTSSLNSYGYSPHPLKDYIEWVFALLTQPTSSGTQPTKPVIISITESSQVHLSSMFGQIQSLRVRLKTYYNDIGSSFDPSGLVGVELNTSCPNIPDHPPPAYHPPDLAPLLSAVASSFRRDPTLTIGLKLPPYVYAAQFRAVLDVISTLSFVSNCVLQPIGIAPALDGQVNPIAYLACTNTLGSSLLFQEQTKDSAGDPLTPALLTSFGGLAGEAIHPIALGNVRAFLHAISDHPDPTLHNLKLIGIGGITSRQAVVRMHAAGAHVVGSATFLGQHGAKAFRYLL